MEGWGFESLPARTILSLPNTIAMDDRSDALLVAEAIAGQADAFSALVRRYQDYAYGTAIGLLSDFDPFGCHVSFLSSMLCPTLTCPLLVRRSDTKSTCGPMLTGRG